MNRQFFSAEKAVDDDGNSFSHTDLLSGSWWQLDLESATDVQSLEVLNRYCGGDPSDPFGCLCRLSNAEVKLFDENEKLVHTATIGDTCGMLSVTTQFNQCYATASPSASPVASTASPTHNLSEYVAKKVKIQSANTSVLHMFEVLVMSNGNNVALNGVSSQSSTFRNAARFASSQAIDENNSTFSHTAEEINSWWQVELQSSLVIEDIMIVNRFCGWNPSDPSGCLCRLSDSTISLLDENDSIVTTRSIGDTCNQFLVAESFKTSSDSKPTYTVLLESTTGQQLQMFELMVHTSSGLNVAPQGTASQSSTFLQNDKFSAYKAIDNSNSTFSHTSDSNPSWEVKLNEDEITRVIILNRYCQSEADPPGCLCRLSWAKLTLLEDDAVVTVKTLGDTCNQPVVSESFISNL
jgi:hypothetical protein